MATSLVLELQREALDKSVSTVDLLRKALVVARKLKVSDIVEWLGHELNGYPEGAKVPAYRYIRGELQVHNPYKGWIPLHYNDSRKAEALSKRGTSQPLSELESIYASRNDGDHVYMPFAKAVEIAMMKGMEYPMKPALIVSMSQVHSIINIVRNSVLELALDLEDTGITGDGMSFTPEEKRQAESLTVNIGNMIGSMMDSQIQQETSNSTQSYKKILDFESTRRVIAELKARISALELDSESKRRIETDVACIESQLDSPQPNVTVIRECLSSARAVLEGAAGSGLFQGIITAIAALV